jgi:myosin-5
VKVTAAPEELGLVNFDLQVYRTVLSDVLVSIYHTVVKHIEHQLAPLVVPAILESEPLAGIDGSRPAPRRNITPHAAVGVSAVVELLATSLSELRRCQVEPRLVKQVFAQLFYSINATMVNTILLRKDLCHWSTGMQVGRLLWASCFI